MSKHVHHWILEPCLLTRPSIMPSTTPFYENGEVKARFDSREIDGELYTARNTRGNIEGVCKCGATRKFHPFAGGVPLTGTHAPVDDTMTRILCEEIPATLA